MKYFEFTCTRNEGRSPIAQLIGQWHLEQKKLDDRYGAISSGSHRLIPNPNEVQSTSNADVPFETLVKMIELGLAQHVFPDAEHAKIRGALTDRNKAELQNYFTVANIVFKDRERHFRADTVHRLVDERGLKGYLKAHSDQTAPRKNVIAVFPMADNNTKQVRDIYHAAGLYPLIETLSAYATGNPQAELPNAFAQGEKFFHDVVDQLWEQIPKAIDRFLQAEQN